MTLREGMFVTTSQGAAIFGCGNVVFSGLLFFRILEPKTISRKIYMWGHSELRFISSFKIIHALRDRVTVFLESYPPPPLPHPVFNICILHLN